MTTQRPAFGKKSSARARGAAAWPDASRPLSQEAQAFLRRERQSSDRPSYEFPSSAGGAPAQSVSAGKPVWGRRVIARLVDEFLVWGIVLLIFHRDIGRQFTALVETPANSPQADAAVSALFVYALMWAFLECVYNITMESSRYQATLGKMMVGAVVTDRNGDKPGLGSVIMRNTLGRFVSNLLPFYAGYVMGLFNKERRCMHDMIASTTVRKRMPAGVGAGYSEVFA